ncbi:BON domain-containing protein [Pseudomonas sp. N040]|uniref:BON domain-containing protein n=1 Tax=Pseudomonas sp. N040 TaxID=2785325 RepID=UPI0018A2E98B|nr:BON domain-containing protein [Pseudomonas sp. N040]MBF7730337.1 BON domain-containing protein [Pseudomonas sp. N040]MBW7013979.1 BON domain-containing protein [Pseudomonas sp. N040]
MIRNSLVIATLACSLALAGCSNRSLGNKIDDQFLDPDVSAAISDAAPDLSSPTSHIVTSSYNGVILIAGQTPRQELKDRAGQAARSVQGVKKVHNELQVQEPTSLLVRSNDSLITSKIKTLMLADASVPSGRIKVITENGVVFLMGIVTRQEGANATRVVEDADGVQKIVKLFEYSN